MGKAVAPSVPARCERAVAKSVALTHERVVMELIVYGLYPGETERYTEELLSAKCRTMADVEAVKSAASKDGFHSFRVAEYNGEAPNFKATIRMG